MELNHNPLIIELETLKNEFAKTTDKIIKDINRQDKIMSRSDKRQKQEYDDLQSKLAEVLKLQLAQKELMDSFIMLIAGAIDAKSKYTGGHCERVPVLVMALAQAASDCNEGIFADFELKTDDDIRELKVASWLHDCGKVIVPEYVVDKATKLETIYNRIHEVRTRFEVIYRDFQIEALQKKLQGENAADVDNWLKDELQKLQDDFQVVAKANVGAEFMQSEVQEKIKVIAKREWVRNFDCSIGVAFEEGQRIKKDNPQTPCIEFLLADKESHIQPREHFDYEDYEARGFKMPVPENLYNFGEIYNLIQNKGTLTHEERFKINEHITMTIKMLETLPFPSNLKNVPIYAGMHHETMIGTGYPRKLTIDDMPIPARIMAISDVFEALTASDRPYKDPKTLSDSIKILSFMVKDQHIDGDLFRLFLSSGVYKNYADKFLKPEQIDDVDLSRYI
jgi:HD-GYP domain-containing protein (c-di-GMP phosphodiesterase class II)